MPRTAEGLIAEPWMLESDSPVLSSLPIMSRPPVDGFGFIDHETFTYEKAWGGDGESCCGSCSTGMPCEAGSPERTRGKVSVLNAAFEEKAGSDQAVAPEQRFGGAYGTRTMVVPAPVSAMPTSSPSAENVTVKRNKFSCVFDCPFESEGSEGNAAYLISGSCYHDIHVKTGGLLFQEVHYFQSVGGCEGQKPKCKPCADTFIEFHRVASFGTGMLGLKGDRLFSAHKEPGCAVNVHADLYFLPTGSDGKVGNLFDKLDAKQRPKDSRDRRNKEFRHKCLKGPAGHGAWDGVIVFSKLSDDEKRDLFALGLKVRLAGNLERKQRRSYELRWTCCRTVGLSCDVPRQAPFSEMQERVSSVEDSNPDLCGVFGGSVGAAWIVCAPPYDDAMGKPCERK